MVLLSRYFLLIISLQLVLSPLAAAAPKTSSVTDSSVNLAEFFPAKKTRKKRNWKKIALALGIPVAVIVAGIVATKVVRRERNNRIRRGNGAAQGSVAEPLVDSLHLQSILTDPRAVQSLCERIWGAYQEPNMRVAAFSMALNTVDEFILRLPEQQSRIAESNTGTIFLAYYSSLMILAQSRIYDVESRHPDTTTEQVVEAASASFHYLVHLSHFYSTHSSAPDHGTKNNFCWQLAGLLNAPMTSDYINELKRFLGNDYSHVIMNAHQQIITLLSDNSSLTGSITDAQAAQTVMNAFCLNRSGSQQNNGCEQCPHLFGLR